MREIPLTQNQVALIDDNDFPEVNQYKWFAANINGIWYACTRMPGRKGNYRMHWLVMGSKSIDHIDGNGLNNQRFNLRKATQQQNSTNTKLSRRNTSGYKGVCPAGGHARTKPWKAQIYPQGRYICLGYFSTAEEAAHAYDAAARQFFGEFARLNFTER